VENSVASPLSGDNWWAKLAGLSHAATLLHKTYTELRNEPHVGFPDVDIADF
jgi:hypothetical protein